jgi:hypothetical protein
MRKLNQGTKAAQAPAGQFAEARTGAERAIVISAASFALEVLANDRFLQTRSLAAQATEGQVSEGADSCLPIWGESTLFWTA